MKYLLTRIIYDYNADTTFGELTCNGVHIGYTLEDMIRLDGSYVYGKTAIPEGEYKMITTWSNRFKREMIQLVNLSNGDLKIGRAHV